MDSEAVVVSVEGRDTRKLPASPSSHLPVPKTDGGGGGESDGEDGDGATTTTTTSIPSTGDPSGGAPSNNRPSDDRPSTSDNRPRRSSAEILRKSVNKIRAMSMIAEGLSSLKNQRTDKLREASGRLGMSGKLHGLLQKHMKKRTFRSMAGANGAGAGHPNNHVHHGPSPNHHGDDHRTHKGYIDGVIRGLLYDKHRGGKDLLIDILHDIETNIRPRKWSLCRAPKPVPRDDGKAGAWDLDSIKKQHPHATRRVAMSIIRSGVAGITFDKFKFDSRSIAHTNMIASFKYRVGTITVGVMHCILGLVEQSYYYDPWAQSFYQPPVVTLPIEIFLIALYVADVILRMLAARNPLDHKWLVLKAILCVLFILDWGIAWANIRECNVGYFAGRTIVSATLPAQLPMAAWFRAFRPLRPLMVLEAVPNLRKEVLSILHCLRALVPVLFLVAIWILVFAIIGMYAFPRKVTAALASANPTEGDIYFTDIYVSIMTFTQIHFGSVIWPDVTMPAMIETNAALYIIFLVFVVMSVVVVTNLLTAVVFQSYNEHAEKNALDAYMQAHVACAVGFRLLSGPSEDGEVMTLGHFIALMRELRPQWNPINFVVRAGQLVSSGVVNPRKQSKAARKKIRKGNRSAPVRRTSSVNSSSDVFDAIDSAFEMANMKQNPNSKEDKERLATELNNDQVFLVIWRELKKIGHDVIESVPGKGVDFDEDTGEELGEELETNGRISAEAPKKTDGAGKHVHETPHKLQADHMTCQQFMHLPEWLDIEIRKEQKLQVGGEASCCMQCRYGGPLVTRRLRDIISSPAYFWFFTIVICAVVATIFLDQVAATRSLGSNTRTLFDGVLLTLMLIDSLCKLFSVGMEPFVRDFWFLFEGIISVASFVVFFVLLIREGGSLDGNQFSRIQQQNRTEIVEVTTGWNTLATNGTGSSSDGVPTASFDALYNTGRILNLIRILPLFRVLNQNPSMRIILKSIYQSITYIMHLLFIVVCIWYIWGGLGVELFGGILRQSEVMDDPQSSYGTAGYVRSPTRVASYASFDLAKEQIISETGVGYDGEYIKVNGVDDIVVSLGGIYEKDPYYAEYQAMNLSMQNLTTNKFEPIKVSTYERQINFDSLFSTMAMTMVHLTLLNNWQVTFDAVVVAFGAAHKAQFGNQSRNVARALAFCYFLSFIVIQVVIVLNILISWFFEVYSNYFQQEHEVLRHRAQIMEEHKNESHGETHRHHHHDVEKSLARLFHSLKRPTRPPVCHVSNIPFSERLCSTRGPCSLETCDVCLRPTRIPFPCKGLFTPKNDRETARIQWIMAPKFIHVVLQNQEPTHAVRNAKLPPHLYPDGPLLIPITNSIWQPIKICSLCYDHYKEYDLFDHNTAITRSTIIRPAESQQNFRQNKYVEEADEISTAGGTPSGTPKSRLHGDNANTMHDKLAVNALVGFGVKKGDLTTVSSSVKTEEVTSSAENNVSNAGHQHSIGSYVSVDELGDLGKLYQSPDNDHSK